MTLRSLTVLAVGAALLVAACGGSSNASSSNASAPASSGGGRSYDYGTASSTPSAAATGGATVKTAKGAQGTFLVDGKGRTLYLWAADTGKTSTCSGECAQDWPPLTTKGKPAAGSDVKASLLGTSKRADGTLEVTYAGHPLYHFAGDQSAGQVNGQGSAAFGAKWWVVSPAGSALQG